MEHKNVLLPYGQGSNSVMQADWLKTFECDVMIGHCYPVMPPHYVTRDLLAILQKRLDRALFSYIFIHDVRSSGVRASISIVPIRKFDKI